MSITIALEPHENPRIDALTDVQRLRWVLEFIQLDLKTLTPEALAALGDDLVHATAPWWVKAGWMDGKTHQCTEILAEDVRALQQEIREGIQAVTGESVPLVESVMIMSGRTPTVGWVLPASSSYLVRLRFDHDGRHVRILRISEGTNDRTAIVAGVVNLIQRFGDRLSTCPVCGALFLRQYRQEYCSLRCSNKVRNRRRLDRKAGQQKSHKRGVKRSADTASLTMA